MMPAQEQSVPEATSQNVLTVPADFVAAKVHNAREAELLLQVSSTASNFATALSEYEVLALKLDALKKSWDELWLSNELTSQIPLVGHAMSQQNAARGAVLQQVEELAACLETQAAALHQFADMRADLARELSAEGLHKLAADKLLLSTVEKELASRITSICTTGSLARFRPMSEFVVTLQASVAKPQEQPVSYDTPKNSLVAQGNARSGDQHANQQPSDLNPAGALDGAVGSLLRAEPSTTGIRQKGTGPAGPASLEGLVVSSLIEQGARRRQEARPQQLGQEAATGEGEEAGLPEHSPDSQPGTSDPGGQSRKRPRDSAGEEQGEKAARRDSAAGQGQVPREQKHLEESEDKGRGSLAAQTPTAGATCLVRQRAEGEAGRNGPGSTEVDGATSPGLQAEMPPDLSNVSERETFAPASGEKANKEAVHSSSPEGSQPHKDGSLSSRERQLLTDERLTPTSPSASRSPITATQSPPSSGRGHPAPSAHLLGKDAGMPMHEQPLDSPAYASSRPTRLSNSSSSPSKSPGSITMSQTGQQGGGLLGRKSQDEPPDSVAAKLPASGLFPIRAPDTARGPPGYGVQGEKPPELRKAGVEKEHEAAEVQHEKQEGGGAWRQVRHVGNTSGLLREDALEAGKEIAPSAASTPEKILDLTRVNAKPPAEWREPPASYTIASAYEPQWQATPSPPECGTQSQSMQAAELDGAADDRVPDSEETRSQSSGRGGAAGPTPFPSSRSSSLGEKRTVTEEATWKQAGLDDNEGGGEEAERAACSQGEWDEEMTQSGATELVPETEEMEEDSPQRDTMPLLQEAAHVGSPRRTQESPALSGSHPASQSPIF